MAGRSRANSTTQFDVTHDLDAPHGLIRFRYDAASNYMFSRSFVSTPRELSVRLQLSLRDIQSFFADSSLIEPRNHCLIVCLGPLNCVILYATAELYIYAPERSTQMGRLLDQSANNGSTTITYLQESSGLPANAVSLSELSLYSDASSCSNSEVNMESYKLNNGKSSDNNNKDKCQPVNELTCNDKALLALLNITPVGAENKQIADFIQNFPLVFKVVSMSSSSTGGLNNNFSPSLFAQRCLESLLMHLTLYYGIRTDRLEALVSDITEVKSYDSIVIQSKRMRHEQKLLAYANVPKNERSLYLFAVENSQAQVMVLRQEVKRMQTVLNRICDAVSSLLDDDADVGGMFTVDIHTAAAKKRFVATITSSSPSINQSAVEEVIKKTMIRNVTQNANPEIIDCSEYGEQAVISPASITTPQIVRSRASSLFGNIGTNAGTSLVKTLEMGPTAQSAPATETNSNVGLASNIFSPAIAARIPGKETNTALAEIRTSLATDLMESYLFQMMRYLKRLEAMDFSLVAQWEGECITLDRRRNYLLNFTVIVNILTIFASLTDFFAICFGANIPTMLESVHIGQVVAGEFAFSIPVTIAVMVIYLWWTNDKRINKKSRS